MSHRVGFRLPARHWAALAGGWLALYAAINPLNAASAPKKATANPVAVTPAAAYVPLVAIVSIGDQHVSIWAGDGNVARSKVSTGMSGHRTPTGVFSVIGKERYHESNLYSNAPMPYMQRITWSGVALHEGNLPGYPASHGCIRMPGEFAQRLFGMTRMGMRVIVTDRDTSPFSIDHPGLPKPAFVRESHVASLVAPTRVAAAQPVLASLSDTSVMQQGRMQLGASTPSADRVLNPMERGKLEQGYVKAASLEAQADTHALLEIAATRGAEARAAADAMRAAEAAVSAIKAGLEKAVEAAANPAATEDERTRSNLARVTLEGAYAAAIQRRDAARALDKEADTAAFQAAAEAKAAIAERDALEDAARIAQRATEPVSVFVSRRDLRVYVRQGFEPVFEADVEITDAQDPLGTHVFTAISALDDGSAMKWTAVSLPDGIYRDEPKPRGPRALKNSVLAPEKPSTALPPTAANALSRVKFGDDVLQKISAKLWVGASLIISDYRLSHETGKATDFVVLTRSAKD